jgi:hypothetical protein
MSVFPNQWSLYFLETMSAVRYLPYHLIPLYCLEVGDNLIPKLSHASLSNNISNLRVFYDMTGGVRIARG